MDSTVEREIKHLIIRYAGLLDARRRDEVAKCFVEDVQADYDGRLFSSLKDLMAFAPVSAFTMIYHHLGQIAVAEVDGHPSAETYSVSYAMRTSDPSTLLIRGTRWFDDFRRVEGQYLIARSVHRTDWSVEAPNVKFTPSSARTTWPGLALPPQETTGTLG